MLQYYSALNLVRGLLLTYVGDIGGRSHGLSYTSGATLLSCTASVSRGGTFRRFVETVGVAPTALDDQTFKLRDLFAVIPEMVHDFPLLNDGASAVVKVRVEAFMRGDTKLRFGLSGVSEEEFATNWRKIFPWFAESCELGAEPFLLCVKTPLTDVVAIEEFCAKHLIHDPRARDDAAWYDDRADLDMPKLPRLGAYLAALFILSNVCRYEPELLETASHSLSDIGYFLDEFLSNADRFFPQVILELLYQQPAFFE